PLALADAEPQRLAQLRVVGAEFLRSHGLALAAQVFPAHQQVQEWFAVGHGGPHGSCVYPLTPDPSPPRRGRGEKERRPLSLEAAEWGEESTHPFRFRQPVREPVG